MLYYISEILGKAVDCPVINRWGAEDKKTCNLPHHFIGKLTTPLPVLLAIVLMVVVALPSYADPNFTWDSAVYWDMRYPSVCAGGGKAIRDTLEYVGYEILDADQLKAWMDAHISNSMPSVVVFCHDIAPDTVVESMSLRCTLRRYLDAGGKIVWYADIPMYYQGHVDGTRTNYGVSGPINILGFNAASGPWDTQDEVTFTVSGVNWGLTETWQSERPTSGGGLRVLAKDNSGYAAAWVKHYVPGDSYRGFVRLFDRCGEPNFNDVRRAAEYPHVPEPFVFDNQAESEDDIIGVFYYPWYRNPAVSGYWTHWEGGGYSPPATWSANYLPNYPDSTWNPSVQLYDCSDTQLLRWQDRGMARAGIDIAIASWWGIGGYEDAAFAKAIRTCKSVQWCIYYEPEGYGDPSPQKIYNDIKYVIDNYGPTRNYAKVDGKWLVLVYVAGGEEAANRWSNAKAMLASGGYDVYLNGDGASAPDPWDSIHSYNSIVRQGLTNTLPNVDDSAWISPGFWGVGESPRLEHSLSEFKSAWNNIVANRDSYRFILIETWNEWHEGTQIEPGQEIVPDPSGYYPAGYDYGYDFIDAIAPAAVNELHWRSSGHRRVVPVHLEAEEMIWDDEQKVLEESPTECRILEEDVRIGSSIFVPSPSDVTFTVRAKAVLNQAGRLLVWPELVFYLDDVVVSQQEIRSLDYQNYSTVVSLDKGIHKVEVGFNESVASSGDIIVDFVDVIFTTPPPPPALSEALDTTLSFTTGGSADWFSQTATSYYGADAAQSGDISEEQDSWMQMTVSGTGTVKFYWKVSSEEDFDFLEFYIDGSLQDRISGSVDWQQKTYTITTSGSHTLEWRYMKDGSNNSGSDCGWVDKMEWVSN
ncbi:MAG: glycoside hydrolase family 71/99 protein [Planctomycetota bacterium]